MKKSGMRGFVIPALAALNVALVSTMALTADAQRPTNALNKTYAVTLGQMVAASTTTILQTLHTIDAPMMAMFNGEKIEIWVLGSRSSPDGARETLENFQDKAWPRLVPMIQALYNIKLSDRQVTVVYRNREQDNIEVIRRENGQYVEKD